MHFFWRILSFVVLLLALASIGKAQETDSAKAELVLLDGKIYTMSDEMPEAEAVAIGDGKILFVGSNEEAKSWIVESTRVVELKGQTVIPGFIESHGHLLGLGELLMELNLTEAKSWNEIVAMVAEAAAEAEPGEWIIGRGWHQSLWDEKPFPNFDGYPSHQALSRVSPNNPVLLTHRSGHMSLANAQAMSEAGVSHATEAPQGGEILRDETGTPIGVFRESAQGLIGRALARSRSDMTQAALRMEFDRKLELAQQECLEHGITTFVDAGSVPSQLPMYERWIQAGKLDLRLWLMLRTNNAVLKRSLPEMKRYHRFGNNQLTVGGIKQMVDGALGAHGAWLLEPYTDLPESRGLEVNPIADIQTAAEMAYESGLQLCVHAIGDRANREMLNLMEPFVERAGDERELRWRIEHAQHLHPDDIPRFAELGVIASMQAIHCTSDAPFVPDRLGIQRSAEGAYVWKSLLKSGAKVVNGTDAPVEPVDPLTCFQASVTRRLANGEVFYPQQVMSREEALRSYTRDAAYAIFEEDIKGQLSSGMLADVVVLSRDILQVPDDELPETEVVMTIVGGRIVYKAE